MIEILALRHYIFRLSQKNITRIARQEYQAENQPLEYKLNDNENLTRASRSIELDRTQVHVTVVMSVMEITRM